MKYMSEFGYKTMPVQKMKEKAAGLQQMIAARGSLVSSNRKVREKASKDLARSRKINSVADRRY